jgi:cyclic dehypoxanthinyl futalosine synthase
MYLDDIDHLQSAEAGAGLKVLQTALRFGADDTEIRIPRSGTAEQDIRRVIRDAGFNPIERDGTYSTLFLN